MNDELLLINAYYYQAVCARELDEPDAEKLFIDLTNNYEENPVTRLAYYQLGNIYYNQKKYDKEIEYYTKVDESDLKITCSNSVRKSKDRTKKGPQDYHQEERFRTRRQHQGRRKGMIDDVG